MMKSIKESILTDEIRNEWKEAKARESKWQEKYENTDDDYYREMRDQCREVTSVLEIIAERSEIDLEG